MLWICRLLLCLYPLTCYAENQLDQARILASDKEYTQASVILASLLSENPENTDALLLFAELESWQKHYESSDALYRQLLELEPKYWQVRLQHARMLSWAGKQEESLLAYSQLDAFPPDIQPLIALESRAKSELAYRQLMGCLESYCCLLEKNQKNLEAHFDLGQLYCRLGLPACSRPHYQAILELEPHHEAAKRVLDASWAHSCPQAELGYLYWWEEGRDDLKDVKRHRSYLRQSIPLQGGNETVSFNVWHSLYELKRLENQNVVSLGFHWQGAPGLRWRLESWVNSNVFTDMGKASVDLGAEALVYVGNAAKLNLGVNHQDLLDNHFLFLERVKSTETWIQWELPIGCRWDLRSRIAERWFSDNNWGILGETSIHYAIKPAPCLLSVGLHGFGYHVRRATKGSYSGGQVLSAEHPYWTPDHYLQGAFSIQWQHHPCDDFFCEIDPLVWDLQYQVAMDNDDELSHSFRGEIGWEDPESWSIKAIGYTLTSQPYKAAQAQLSIGRRL